MDEYTPEPDEPDHFDPDDGPDAGADDVAEPPHPVNWNLLSADDLEVEWLALNDWVCLLYTSPSPTDRTRTRMPSSS